MIYHQQQRSKDKLSPSDNKKDDEQQQQQLSLTNKLPDLISNTKPLLPPPTSDLSLPLPSTYQTPLLPPPSFSMFFSFFFFFKIKSYI
jgi:hypothetical protein